MSDRWHRCSPAAGIYFFLRNLRGLLNLWPALAVLVASDGWRSPYVWSGAALLVLGLVAVSALHWWRYRFQYDDRHIQIHSGILNRKRLSLDFDRVQETSLSQPWYFRPVNLWHLGLESAGSASQEVKVPGIRQEIADDIRGRFRRYKAAEKEIVNSDEVAAESPPLLDIPLSAKDLFRYGLMHNSLIYLAPVLGTLFGSTKMTDWLVVWVRGLPLFDWVNTLLGAGILVVALLTLVLVLIALAFLYGLSILFAVAKYWRYHLTVRADQFQYQAGLFNRLDRGFKHHKLQCLVVKQGVMARLLKRYTVELQQANDTAGGGGLGGFLIPVMTSDELARLLSLFKVEVGEWRSTQAVRMVWDTLAYGSLGLLAWLVAGWFVAWVNPWFAGVSYLLVAGLSYLRWRKNKYSDSKDWMAIQTGFWGYRRVYIPAIKIQKLELAHGPVLKHHDCAGLKVWSGARAADIAFVKQTDLMALRDRLLAEVGAHKGRWM